MKLQSKSDTMQSSIDHMDVRLTRVLHLLDGNSTPERGFIVRLDRLEQDHRKTVWLSKSAIGAAIGVIVLAALSWLLHLPNSPESNETVAHAHGAK